MNSRVIQVDPDEVPVGVQNNALRDTRVR